VVPRRQNVVLGSAWLVVVVDRRKQQHAPIAVARVQVAILFQVQVAMIVGAVCSWGSTQG
jgi:hypothetical protein